MPHLLYLAIGFPPAAKSSAYRMSATANLFAELGWDVTVLTIDRRAWDREYGTDASLEARVDPRVRQVELPLARVDLDPDLRHFGWLRARFPERWLRLQRRLDTLPFPEPVFGAWRDTLEEGAERVHRERPVDLALVSPSPYVMLAAAWRLHDRHGVPYAIDYRDAWSLDVVEGVESFGRASRAGRWESRLVANALAVWTVNEPIRDFYRSRYPDQAEKVVVARNGFDSDLLLAHADEQPSPGDKPLTFGYLGTVNLRPAQLQAIVDGWTLAREREPALRDARLVFRGHMGAGIAKAANANARIVADAAQAGVSYGGPVAKADVVGQYAAWDALVLALAGGPYVTSGKIFEYVSTGLPIVSAHQKDHAAADVLRDYPLWAPTEGLDPEHMAAAFARGARLARDAGHEERAAAREYAQQFERLRQLRPAVTALADAVTGATRSVVPTAMPETETVGENA